MQKVRRREEEEEEFHHYQHQTWEEEESESLIKDLKRQANSPSRGTVKASPRTGEMPPPLENRFAVA
jgi:hypothetical protein